MLSEDMYVLVLNIPCEYRTPDLRNYFFDFIEKEAFICFHFRHRPTEQFFIEIDNLCKLHNTKANEDIVHGNNSQQNNQCITMSQHKPEDSLSSLKSIIKSAKETYKSKNPTVDVKTKIDLRNQDEKHDGNIADNCTEDSTCCVIDIKDEFRQSFIELYNNKHWINKEGDVMKSRCIIQGLDNFDVFNHKCTTYLTKGDKIAAFGKITSELKDLIELKPPPAMPHGNVGTSIEFFKKEIKLCRFPAILIKKLGLEFKRSRRRRRFGEVPFSYGTTVQSGSTSSTNNVVFTANGDLIPISYDFNKIKKLKCKEKHKGVKMESIEHPTEDGSDVEEWERSEAFYDDVTKQGRCKERLYEEEIELQWEKGGSGLVFYTDAQYWKEQEGDFDERTANEWDVDMSGYYGEDNIDADARDSISMLHSTRLKNNTLQQSVFSSDKHKTTRKRMKGPCAGPPKIGKFETHTRGIGRKLMESQGWKEGEGLGKKNDGLPQALDNDGQHPTDKSGFGYYGPKLNVENCRTEKNKHKRRHHDEETVYIGTVFDLPQYSDAPPHSLRRPEPTTLSHFDISSRINFQKSTSD